MNLTKGPRVLKALLNELIRKVSRLDNISGDGIIVPTSTKYGLIFKLNVARLQAKMPRYVGEDSVRLFKTVSGDHYGYYYGVEYEHDSSRTAGDRMVAKSIDTFSILNLAEVDVGYGENELPVGSWLMAQSVQDTGTPDGTRLIGWSPRFSWWDV